MRETEATPSDDETSRWKAQYAELATLAGGLAHEIRNPLSTMSLNLELLQEDLATGETPRDRRLLQKLVVIQRECGRLERILQDFLQFVRSGSIHDEPTALNDVLIEFMESFRPQAADVGVDIVPHFAAQLPLVAMDRPLFHQVLNNLGRNALQAMPEGGRLELLTYSTPTDVVLEVIDNGVGMDDKTQQRMFDVFFSTKRGGSGLGLPTAMRIIEAHGGRLTCESAQGKGTRFLITLPIRSAIEQPT